MNPILSCHVNETSPNQLNQLKTLAATGSIWKLRQPPPRNPPARQVSSYRACRNKKKLLTLPISPIYWTRQWISALPRTPDHCDATVEKCQSLHLCNFPKYLASLFSSGILSKSSVLIISINIFLIPQGLALRQAWGQALEKDKTGKMLLSKIGKMLMLTADKMIKAKKVHAWRPLKGASWWTQRLGIPSQ